MADRGDREGLSFYRSEFRDRFAKGGELNNVTSAPSIFEQFPLTAEFTRRVVEGGYKKVCLLKNPVLPSTSGHHGAKGGKGSRQVYPVDHFKWTADMMASIERRYARSKGTFDWSAESGRLLKHVQENQGRINYPMRPA
jgi:hypothetical protein